jgi:hypothetical protein
MYNENIERENEILKLAIEAFRKNVPFQVNIEALFDHADYDHGYDLELDVEITGKRIKYCAEIKNALTRTNVILFHLHKNELPHPFLLVTKYVNPLMAERLFKNHIEFIDTAGNAFINQPPIYIFIKGNKPTEITEIYPTKKTFAPTGLKIIYALLCNPGLENKPFREITAKAKVALGTVGWFMRDLKELGFLMDMGNRGYKLFQKDKLLQRWITEYPERLRPKQMLGHYKGEYDGWWNKKQLHNLNAKWGGEVAAAKLTHYNLNPETITIYTKTEYLNNLLIECRLKKDPTGEVEILNQFWDYDEDTKDRYFEYFQKYAINADYEDLVNPMLIYADLIAIGNQRNIETAKEIYERHIVQLIGKD